jgi:hypothetical protein
MTTTTIGVPPATTRPSSGRALIWAWRNKTIIGGTLILLALLGVVRADQPAEAAL